MNHHRRRRTARSSGRDGAEESDLLAKLDHPWKVKLVQDVLRDYPALTVEEAVEMLDYFGGL